jgi:hypothetical protein
MEMNLDVEASGKKNNSELVKAVKGLEDTENRYIIELIQSASIWRTEESILCIWIWENWRIDVSIVLQRVFWTLWKACPKTA